MRMTSTKHGVQNMDVRTDNPDALPRVFNIHAKRQGVKGDTTLLNIRVMNNETPV